MIPQFLNCNYLLLLHSGLDLGVTSKSLLGLARCLRLLTTLVLRERISDVVLWGLLRGDSLLRGGMEVLQALVRVHLGLLSERTPTQDGRREGCPHSSLVSYQHQSINDNGCLTGLFVSFTFLLRKASPGSQRYCWTMFCRSRI